MAVELTQLDIRQVLRALGYGGQAPDETILDLVRRCAGEVVRTAVPRWRSLTLSVLGADGNGVHLEGGLTLPGQSIREHLRGCSRAAVFCATLSAPVDTLLRRAQAEDLARALVLDCCASQAIEEVCDRVEEEIKAGFPDCSFPYRFSPGYGDLPITLQGQLLALLDAPRRIGLCASGSHILIPRKSVTAILGISREPLLPAEQRTCSQCFLRGRCQYQLRGKTCGS